MKLPWALACAGRGWLVFPSRGKKPLVKWSTGSTTDHDLIHEYWGRWPDADVCIKTGAESNLVVVDWDVYKQTSPTWPLALDPPTTYTTRTAKGGIHFYFTHPGYPVSNSTGALAEHVDVRGDGGMVVAYQAVLDVPLAAVPEGWATQRERTVNYTSSLVPDHCPNEEPQGRFAVLLRGAASRVTNAPDGERNATLYRQASDMYRLLCWEGVIGMDYVTEVMGDAGYQAGLEPHEIAATLLSAQRNAASRKETE